jgi:hypothetical protein
MIICIFFFFLSVFSLEPKPKLCINCKYFSKNQYLSDNAYGRCASFPYKINEVDFLVTGIGNTQYLYCSTARGSEDMCGQNGKKYIERDFNQSDRSTGKDI